MQQLFKICIIYMCYLYRATFVYVLLNSLYVELFKICIPYMQQKLFMRKKNRSCHKKKLWKSLSLACAYQACAVHSLLCATRTNIPTFFFFFSFFLLLLALPYHHFSHSCHRKNPQLLSIHPLVWHKSLILIICNTFPLGK